MMRRTPMKRGGFQRNQPALQETSALQAIKSVASPVRRAVMTPINDAVFAQPKENALQHERYMSIVRLLPCAHCGIAGYTQFCHADAGKGMAIKTDCRRGWPGCGPRPGLPGCHHLIGTSAAMTREQTRALEEQYGAQTRAKVLDLNLWPKNLPLWLNDSTKEKP